MTKTMTGGKSQSTISFLTPTAARPFPSKGAIGFASRAPHKMPSRENPTRMAPCRKPRPANEAMSKTANNQIVINN